MSDPGLTPARMPPPGVVSNLIDPVSTGYQQTTCNILCLIFVTLFVSMRIYTRIRLVKCVGWDDCKFTPTLVARGASFEKSCLLMVGADLIMLATLVFYVDVGCFQYIVTVGLVRIHLPHSCILSYLSNTPNRADIYGTSAQIDSRHIFSKPGRSLP
jgi:hypothetical protein